MGAKEIVASTIGVIYSGDDSFGDDDSNIEGVCVMDFSGFREYLKENSI